MMRSTKNFQASGGRDTRQNRTPDDTQNKFRVVSDLHHVGGGYAAQFSACEDTERVLSIKCTWSPTIPAKQQINWDKYQSARDHFLKELLRRLESAHGDAP
jgi:hypothetical protein